MMDWKNFTISNLLDIGPNTSQRRSRVAEISTFPIKYFEQRILHYDWPRILHYDWPIFSNEQKEQIVNNFKKLDNVHSNVTTIQLFTRIYNNPSHSHKNPVPILPLIFFFHSKSPEQLNYKFKKYNKMKPKI